VDGPPERSWATESFKWEAGSLPKASEAFQRAAQAKRFKVLVPQGVFKLNGSRFWSFRRLLETSGGFSEASGGFQRAGRPLEAQFNPNGSRERVKGARIHPNSPTGQDF